MGWFSGNSARNGKDDAEYNAARALWEKTGNDQTMDAMEREMDRLLTQGDVSDEARKWGRR